MLIGTHYNGVTNMLNKNDNTDLLKYISYSVKYIGGKPLQINPIGQDLDSAWLVGWQRDAMVVAVFGGEGYLPHNAVDMATEFLVAHEWFTDCENPPKPDFWIQPIQVLE